MTTELNTRPNPLYKLATDNGVDITDETAKQFVCYYDQAREWLHKAKTIEVTAEDQAELMKTAREGRLFIKAIRVDVEKKRKELKEDSLKTGRAIDGVANLLKGLLEPIEQHLDKQEKFAENLAKERRKKLVLERVERLTQYVADTSFYDLGGMPDEAFEELFNASKIAHDKRRADRLAADEKDFADKQAEAKRIADQNVENARLKKEADDKQAELDAANLKIKEAADKQAATDAADQLRADAEARKALAPDKEKLEVLAGVIESVAFPVISDAKAQGILTQTRELLEKTANHIRTKSQQL